MQVDTSGTNIYICIIFIQPITMELTRTKKLGLGVKFETRLRLQWWRVKYEKKFAQRIQRFCLTC